MHYVAGSGKSTIRDKLASIFAISRQPPGHRVCLDFSRICLDFWKPGHGLKSRGSQNLPRFCLDFASISPRFCLDFASIKSASISPRFCLDFLFQRISRSGFSIFRTRRRVVATSPASSLPRLSMKYWKSKFPLICVRILLWGVHSTSRLSYSRRHSETKLELP